MELRSQDGEMDAVEILIARILQGVYTSIPGIISSFDKDQQTVRVIPAIKAVKTVNGEKQLLKLPELIEVPVCFPSSNSSKFSLTHPIQKGDECLLVFSMRSIDNWYEFGGFQGPVEPVTPRSHNISDAICIMAPHSLGNVISNFQDDCIEIRNEDRTVRASVYNDRVELAAGGSSIVINSGGGIVITPASGSTTINGNLNITGEATIGGIEFSQHTHEETNGMQTGPPE